MKNLSALFLALLACAVYSAAAEDIAIVHAGRLLAVPGQEVKEAQSVVIRGGKITDVRSGYIDADAVNATGTDQVRVHDLKHMFVLPGLIDGHVHLTTELGPNRKKLYAERSDPDYAMYAARNARLTLEAGFTTVRDVGKSDVLGSIEVGKYGDLVAVDGDPGSDISELLDVDFVMREGIVYKSP